MVESAISWALNGTRPGPKSNRSTGTEAWMKFSQRTPPEKRQVSFKSTSNLPYTPSVTCAAR